MKNEEDVFTRKALASVEKAERYSRVKEVVATALALGAVFLAYRTERWPGTQIGTSDHRCWPDCGSLHCKDQDADQPEHKGYTAGDCRREPRVRTSRAQF